MNLHALIYNLESVYGAIEKQRMQSIPVCNPALKVEAVGFRQWQDYFLGAMITPWFMNLMLLPIRPQDFNEKYEGGKQTHNFPSGCYEFVFGSETDLGNFQVCSLFSPMSEFKNQQSAVATAELALVELMQPEISDTLTSHKSVSRREFLNIGQPHNREYNNAD